MTYELLLAVALFAFSTSITPGPNNIMVMASGLNHGVVKSLPHFLGIIIGFPSMIVLVGLGLSSVFEAYPLVHEVIRWVGIAYLLYLAWIIANTRAIGDSEARKPISFLQAAAFQWVNPKAWIMVVGALAAFSQPGTGLWMSVAIIAAAFIVIGGPCVAAWMLFGVGLKRYLNDPAHLRRFNIGMAILLVASIIPMVL